MKDAKSMGRIVGNIFGVVVSLCAMALIIAVTTRIIFWII